MVKDKLVDVFSAEIHIIPCTMHYVLFGPIYLIKEDLQ